MCYFFNASYACRSNIEFLCDLFLRHNLATFVNSQWPRDAGDVHNITLRDETLFGDDVEAGARGRVGAVVSTMTTWLHFISKGGTELIGKTKRI